MAETHAPPNLSLQEVSVENMGGAGDWRVTWEVLNVGAQPVDLLAVRLPHGQFKSQEHRFAPALVLAAGEKQLFSTRVRCLEPPGPVTENAFVIFHVHWLDEKWRVFVRIRVEVDAGGTPKTAVELVTTQKAGFSGISD